MWMQISLITENIVAMVRVTQPTNEEIGYVHNVMFLYLSVKMLITIMTELQAHYFQWCAYKKDKRLEE